ncbi:DUF1214 domain-containing protein [Streptomyces hirsutus]|uniref:DUF1214 domain-containing protein n=1 Tax=Streptomyces hirsutus TaxID=35620 RepID=UPI003684C920
MTTRSGRRRSVLDRQRQQLPDRIGRFGDDFLNRTADQSLADIVVNDPAEAVRPVNFHDANGVKLSANGRYELHFPPDRLPLVDAFWSMTAYSAPGRNLIPNPANRYSVGDRAPGPKTDPASISRGRTGQHLSLSRRMPTVLSGPDNRRRSAQRYGGRGGRATPAACPRTRQRPHPGMISDSDGSSGDAGCGGQTRRRHTGPSATSWPPCNVGGRTSWPEFQRGGATDPRQPQPGPSHRRDRRLRLARNAHTGTSALRATARGARVDSAQSAGKAARSRTDRLIRRSYA